MRSKIPDRPLSNPNHTIPKDRYKHSKKDVLDISSTLCILSLMEADLKALGEMLRDARNEAGLTLREAEAKAKVSNAYLSQLEGAKIKQPSPAILHKLCSLYDCSYAAALEMAGYPIPNPKLQPLNSRFVARLGKTTSEEQDALLEYLQFLRSRKR